MTYNARSVTLFMDNREPNVKTSCAVSVLVTQKSSDGFFLRLEANLTDKNGGKHLKQTIRGLDFTVDYQSGEIKLVYPKKQ